MGANHHFDRVLREYTPALARLAASYERVPSRREELLQDIALALWQAWPTFRGECSERTFAFRIAHNRALSHAWKRAPTSEPLDVHEPIDPRPPPEQLVQEQQRRRQLGEAIWALSLAHRQVVLLLLEDLSHAEIAAVLGITENNVAVRLNRARAALQAAMRSADE